MMFHRQSADGGSDQAGEIVADGTKAIQDVVADALLLRTATPTATGGFVRLRHNRDLCPGVEQRLDQLLEGVSKRVAVVADIQGVNDHGVDVLITIESDTGRRYIAIQIKSDVEASENDLLRKLKAGFFDARARYDGPDPADRRLVDYYIFLAWDMRAHLDRVRRVTADFATMEPIHVVRPTNAWAFYDKSSKAEIDAIVTLSATEQDPLLRSAQGLVAGLSHSALATLLVALAAWIDAPGERLSTIALEASRFRSEMIRMTAVLEAYEVSDVEAWVRIPQTVWLPTDPWAQPAMTAAERLAVDLDSIDDLVAVETSASVQFVAESVAPMVALAYDAHARYHQNGEELVSYMFDLLTTRELSPKQQGELSIRLGQIVGYSSVPKHEAVQLLADMLILNCSRLLAPADEAESANRLASTILADEGLFDEDAAPTEA